MQGADEFLDAIMQREFDVMDAVLADAPSADWAHPGADGAARPEKTGRRAAQSSA